MVAFYALLGLSSTIREVTRKDVLVWDWCKYAKLETVFS